MAQPEQAFPHANTTSDRWWG